MVSSTTNYNFNLPEVNSATDEDLWGGFLNDNWDDADSLFKTRTDSYDFNDQQIVSPELIDYAETRQTVSISSGQVTIDFELGNHVTITLTENITSFVLSNVAASSKVMPLILYLTQDGTGGRTVTFPSEFVWAGGAVPTVTSTANAEDIYIAITPDNGTTWYANLYGQDFS